MKSLILSSVLIICLMINSYSQGGSTGTPTDNALYLSQSMPGEMEPAVNYNVSVSMKNTGSTVWNPSTHSLKLVDATDAISRTWPVNSVALSKSINPGEMHTFYFRVKAPLSEGGYNIQWRMSNGTVFFGEPTMNVPIRIAGPTGSIEPKLKTTDDSKPFDNATFLSISMPLNWDDGHVYDGSIMLRNTGKTDWTVGDYKLRIFAKGSDNSPSSMTISYIDLPNTFYAGTDGTIYISILAPESDGVYNVKAQMVKNGVSFGEPSQEIIINVH